MIAYNPKSWIQLIFGFHKSDTFRILWKEIIYMGVFTLILAYVEINYFPNTAVLEKLMSVYSLIGFVISLLLVFRTNTAYDRWWEGRKKWGEVVNDSRNIAVKLSGMLKEPEDRQYFSRMISNFVFAMKEQLRNGVDLDELDLSKEEKEKLIDQLHIPSALSALMYKRIKVLRDEEKLSDYEFLSVNENLNNLLNCMGACERIKKTPIPYSYSLFLKKFIFIYVTTLPFAFVNLFGYYSALIATFVFYVLVSMEVLAEEIEDPFGVDDNDLPTDDIALQIRNTVRQILN